MNNYQVNLIYKILAEGETSRRVYQLNCLNKTLPKPVSYWQLYKTFNSLASLRDFRVGLRKLGIEI